MVVHARPFGYRVPSPAVPRTALHQTNQRKPTAADKAELANRVDGVLAAGRHEPARGRPQRRNQLPVPLDHTDSHSRRPPPDGWAHRVRSINCRARLKPARTSCCSRAETADRLLGSARITMRSAGSSSARTVRAACRSRRATRCRSTALPTAFVTTNPIRGPGSAESRRACTTISGCTARTPCLTVVPNSADRVIRNWAGSTRVDRVRQSDRDGPCGAYRPRSPVRPECASATGNHEPVRAAGCSAGRSACPWPRLRLLVMCAGTAPAQSRGEHLRCLKLRW